MRNESIVSAEGIAWLIDLNRDQRSPVDGLVQVEDYDPFERPPEEVVVMEHARTYKAHSVFFQAERDGRAPTPQAFVYVSKDGQDDEEFADLHKRLWSWGGVPLLYRNVPGQIQLFRCAHGPDFVRADGTQVCCPFKTLETGSRIAAVESWWDARQIRNGTLWDDPSVCRQMLSARVGAHRKLVEVIRSLYVLLNDKKLLSEHLRQRLLVLSILIAYLEERRVLQANFFGQFLAGASRFFQVLRDGDALVRMLEQLESRFNGNVFALTAEESNTLRNSTDIELFAQLVEGFREPNGQMTFWRLYSFKDLPIELLSHIYQLFVDDCETSVYTPPKLVGLMIGEALSWERLDRLAANNEVILDPACGSGIFLVQAYKRLVLHWRSKNEWTSPSVNELKAILDRVHGIDLEQAAVELADFSLCLALCDALQPEEIRSSVGLFPRLVGNSIHQGCFFDARERSLIDQTVGVVLGNPPFKSGLTTPAAERSYRKYLREHGLLADKQLAYLFLHEAMMQLVRGGVLCMIQPAGFLYNRNAETFRLHFFARWDVREVLDFVSVRGLFKKANADPKVVVVLAASGGPESDSKVLHAVFRRNGRATAEQGFDIDYYDLHWVTMASLSEERNVWRANLLGGGRFLDFLKRLREYPTLGEYARNRSWHTGEGFIAAKKGDAKSAEHLIGRPLLPTKALSSKGIETSALSIVPNRPIRHPKTERHFEPPLLLVKEHQDLYRDVWTKHYLTYKHEIFGFAAPSSDTQVLHDVKEWISDNELALKAYVAGISIRLFNQRATSISAADILALPYPTNGSLNLSDNEKMLMEDVVVFIRDFVRRGSDSALMRPCDSEALRLFADVFVLQLSTVYPDVPPRPLEPYHWPGIICQPFAFGGGEIDWAGADQLRHRLESLLQNGNESSLAVTRIARIYDRNFVFLLKPDRFRFWLRSIALRDADDVRADLRSQGF